MICQTPDGFSVIVIDDVAAAMNLNPGQTLTELQMSEVAFVSLEDCRAKIEASKKVGERRSTGT